MAEFVAHEVELFAGVRVLECIGEAEVCKFLPVVTWHLAEHGTFAVYHFVMAENLYEIFRISIDHAEGELVVVVLAVDGLVLDVAEEVIHPAHVPLVVEAETALLWRTRDARETRRFFGNEDCMRREATHDAVQVLQEFDGVIIDVATVFVRNPLAGALAVVKVEHGCHRIDAEAVAVEFLEPVHGVCNEEVLDFVTAQVENVGAPVRVFALSRVGMLVAGCAVKAAEGVRIFREVGWNPVQDDSDFVLVAEIDKVTELVRRAVTARWGVVTCHLVAPGFVERVFGDGQKFYVRVAHFLEVGNEAFGKFVPVEETVGVCRVAAPGTGVDFVNVHWASEDFGRPMRLHVKFVAPFVTVEVSRDGCCCRTDFGEFCERVHFHMELAIGTVDFKTVEFAFAKIRNENFPDAACAEHAHLVTASIPAVEVPDDRYRVGVRCPYGKVDALESLMFDEVCAELAVEFVVRAGGNEVPVEFAQHGHECVRIDERVFVAVVLADNQLIKEWFVFQVEDGFEKSRVIDFYKVKFFGTVT